MQAESLPRRRADVNTRVVDGETVVLDRQKELVHQLNQTASYIWERCDGKSTEEEIAARLVEAFDIDPKTAAQDVANTVQSLRDLCLLESRPDKPVLKNPNLKEN